MDNYPEGVAQNYDISKYIDDYFISSIHEKYGTRICCVCDENSKEYPFLCGHATHQKCLETWLKNNPFKLICFTCKAPLRSDIYKIVKPKSVNPVSLTDEEKIMLAQFNYIECPRCKILIEKNGGCNSMHCINCGDDFKYELPVIPDLYGLTDPDEDEKTKFQKINKSINCIMQKYQGIDFVYDNCLKVSFHVIKIDIYVIKIDFLI